MSGQYTLCEDDKNKILKILKDNGIDTIPSEQEIGVDGVARPFHREVTIHVCDYDDETNDYNIYVQVD